MTEFIDQSIKTLKQAGYKITGPRMATLEALSKAKSPLSAYDLEKAIPKNIPINIVTIYRVLDLFEELGIVHKIMSKQGYMRCEHEGEKGCHHFMVCKKCDEATEFIQKNCSSSIQLPKSFSDVQHVSEYIGICKKCS